MISKNSYGEKPLIHGSAFIHPTAVIIGNVRIGKNVFVGPCAVIRADEPKTSIVIGDNCNVQDRVVVHALQNSAVLVGEETSLSHGCIVHGPVKIGKKCFVGFGSVVFNAELCDGVVVKHLAVIEEAVIPAGKCVAPLQLVNSKAKVNKLKKADKDHKCFVDKVVSVNLMLTEGYRVNC
jgi:carbonic anhydrase